MIAKHVLLITVVFFVEVMAQAALDSGAIDRAPMIVRLKNLQGSDLFVIHSLESGFVCDRYEAQRKQWTKSTLSKKNYEYLLKKVDAWGSPGAQQVDYKQFSMEVLRRAKGQPKVWLGCLDRANSKNERFRSLLALLTSMTQ